MNTKSVHEKLIARIEAEADSVFGDAEKSKNLVEEKESCFG